MKKEGNYILCARGHYSRPDGSQNKEVPFHVQCGLELSP